MDVVADLEAADEELAAARERVEAFGEPALERLVDAHGDFTDLLDRYEEPATGDGDFQLFIEFQGKIENFVEGLPEDLLLRETFEECDDYLQQRRLTESDFDHVRDQLEPVADLAGRLDDRRAALRRYRKARSAVAREKRAVAERIDALERLLDLGEADLDAPIERLRDPIERYNDAVGEAFDEFRSSAPTREVLDLLDATTAFPLVPFRAPPADLHDFLAAHEVGAEPIHRVLELADYSRSKLDHYVDDPDGLKRTVATQQTYLQRLDSEPLEVTWPPPPAPELRLRTREYRSVLNRFAPDVVERLRTVRRLPVETPYDCLRESAVAAAELSADERERLRSGDVDAELADARDEYERLVAALAEYPDR